MTLEACSDSGSSEDGQGKAGRLARGKPKIDWKKLKLGAEIRDLHSSYREEDECGEEGKEQGKSLLGRDD